VLALRIADERGTYLVLPTTTFTDRYVIDDAVAPVEALFLGPGHTDGDIVVWMPKQRAVAAGDLIVAPIPFGGTNVTEWSASLEKLLDLRPTVIVPGHGTVQHSAAYAKLMISTLDDLCRQVALLPATPLLADDTVIAKTNLAAERARFAAGSRWRAFWFDQYVTPNAATAYHELHRKEK
jgi:glyoxylase-like metal-dependent hydrolase (beta-lactamase superfamily II)